MAEFDIIVIPLITLFSGFFGALMGHYLGIILEKRFQLGNMRKEISTLTAKYEALMIQSQVSSEQYDVLIQRLENKKKS